MTCNPVSKTCFHFHRFLPRSSFSYFILSDFLFNITKDVLAVVMGIFSLQMTSMY